MSIHPFYVIINASFNSLKHFTIRHISNTDLVHVLINKSIVEMGLQSDLMIHPMALMTFHDAGNQIADYEVPCMRFKDIDKVLRKNGWFVVRVSKSSHYQYRREGSENLVTVPNHGSKDISKGTLGSIERQSGLVFR